MLPRALQCSLASSHGGSVDRSRFQALQAGFQLHYVLDLGFQCCQLLGLRSKLMGLRVGPEATKAAREAYGEDLPEYFR